MSASPPPQPPHDADQPCQANETGRQHPVPDPHPAGRQEGAARIAPWRAQGVRLGVDDAGAGFASFQHILRLRPDIIKMDIALTRAVDTDLPRQSLASALVLFAERTQAQVIAEGVESEAEWTALQALGVHRGQGYFLVAQVIPKPHARCVWADRVATLLADIQQLDLEHQ